MNMEKIKINILRVILLILLLGTFFAIFGFSSQNGEESGSLSKNVAKFFLEKIVYHEKEINEQVLETTTKVIRKVAHFSIYTVVGFLLMSFVSTYNLKERKRVLMSLCIGILYATSDEIHQAFVPGRGSQVTDVMIDSMGVVLGILIVLFILKILRTAIKK